ncbi:hypothetical protein MKX03_020817, partial [Papaver bracteatum]
MKSDNNRKAMNKYSRRGHSNAIISSSIIRSSTKSDKEESIREHKKMKVDNNWKLVRNSRKRDEEESIREHKKMKVDNRLKSMRNTSSIFDCNDILLEVLSRLPVKSLMLCKCVSKHWKFTISQDQDFIDLHFAQSKQRCSDLFIVVPRDMIQRAIHNNSGFKSNNSWFKSRGARQY